MCYRLLTLRKRGAFNGLSPVKPTDRLDSIPTRLESHLAEKHPKVTEVESTLDHTGRAVAEGHAHEAGGLALPVNVGPEGHRVGLPI